MLTFVYLPGKFAKFQVNGQTTNRVHALQSGLWTTCGNTVYFASESEALAWLMKSNVTWRGLLRRLGSGICVCNHHLALGR